MALRRRCTGLLATAAGAVLVAACGSSSSSAEPQTGSNQPLTAASVDVRPSGNADFTVNGSTVRFQVDNAGLLRMTVGITSHAAALSTVTMTARLLDSGGASVGTAVGGNVDVAPGASQTVELSGNRPSGVIAVVELVIAGQPAPTPRPS